MILCLGMGGGHIITRLLQSRPRSFQVGRAPDNPGGRHTLTGPRPPGRWRVRACQCGRRRGHPTTGAARVRAGGGLCRLALSCLRILASASSSQLRVRVSSEQYRGSDPAPNRQWAGPVLNFAVKEMTPTRDRRAISESAAPDRTKPQVASAVSLTSTAQD